jgi:hypothetical protein
MRQGQLRRVHYAKARSEAMTGESLEEVVTVEVYLELEVPVWTAVDREELDYEHSFGQGLRSWSGYLLGYHQAILAPLEGSVRLRRSLPMHGSNHKEVPGSQARQLPK